MIEISVLKNQLSITEREPITSGSVNVYTVHFHFSSHWDGLEKIAIFRTPETIINVLVEDNKAVVPWEVTLTPGFAIRVGVYGIQAGEVILPTVWGLLNTVEEGVIIGDAESGEHTPDIYDTILQKVNEVNNGLATLQEEMNNLRDEIPSDDELTAIIERILESSNTIQEVVNSYLKANPPEISEQTLSEAITNYLTENQIGITEERVLELINQTVGAAISDGY